MTSLLLTTIKIPLRRWYKGNMKETLKSCTSEVNYNNHLSDSCSAFNKPQIVLSIIMYSTSYKKFPSRKETVNFICPQKPSVD